MPATGRVASDEPAAVRPRTTRRRVTSALVGVALAGAGLAAAGPAAPAGAVAPIVIDKAGDTAAPSAANCLPPAGNCTLRDAFAAAAAAGADAEIDIPAALSPITLTTGTDLVFPGPHSLTVKGTGGTATIQQTGATDVIENDNAGTMTLQNLVVTGGNSGGLGGGIFSDPSGVTLLNTTIRANKAPAGGGLFIVGLLQVIDSTITQNTSTGAANGGGGIVGGSGGVLLINSTVSGNTAVNDGGGLLVSPGTLTAVYSTIAGNTAPTAANIALGGGVTFTSFASVVALPLGGGLNCAGLLPGSQGFNLEDDAAATCGFATATHDLTPGTNPLLGALADNGGPTLTRLPLTGSPLIDAVPAASCKADGAAGVTTDQRGVTRPQGPGCDVGAVEVAVPVPVVVTPTFTG